MKHGAPGGPITIALRSSPTDVTISVHNVGEPIAPDEVATIFQPFRRSRGVQSKCTKGWGLGLTLVKAIAEAHGGSVHVESSASAGTRFEIVLRRDARPAQARSECAPGLDSHAE